jgi:hypothetical protein
VCWQKYTLVYELVYNSLFNSTLLFCESYRPSGILVLLGGLVEISLAFRTCVRALRLAKTARVVFVMTVSLHRGRKRTNAPHDSHRKIHTRTLDPIRCTLCVNPGGSRVLTSGQNQLFPSRGYTAETYAKVMGSSSPSQPRIKLKYTLFVC